MEPQEATVYLCHFCNHSTDVCMYVCNYLAGPFQLILFCNSCRILMIPQSLKELQEVIALHHRLVSEIAEREATFPVIRDQCGILCKLSIQAFLKVVN